MKKIGFGFLLMTLLLFSIAVAVSADGSNFAPCYQGTCGTDERTVPVPTNYNENRCCADACCQPYSTCCQSTCQPARTVCGDTSGTYCVTYHENNCLDSVPVDPKTYRYGETVTVLFDPVMYKSGLIFYGWSHYPYGPAHYGYAYNQFRMPAKNVDLYAICIRPYYPPVQNCPNCPDPDWPDQNWPIP